MVQGRKPDLQRRRKVAELWGRGLTVTEISRELGCRKQNAAYLLQRSGRPARDYLPLRCRRCRVVVTERLVLRAQARRPLCLACLARSPRAPFAERLCALQLARGWTRKELARRCGLTHGRLRNRREDGSRRTRGSNRSRRDNACVILS